MKQIPAALGVLRREIDRNPDDPGLYERLAVFLDQNRLGIAAGGSLSPRHRPLPRQIVVRQAGPLLPALQERFRVRAIDPRAVKTFQGSELEQYFNNVVGGSPALYLRLNQYANQRFPHNPVFVRNLLECLSVAGHSRSGRMGSLAAPALV